MDRKRYGPKEYYNRLRPEALGVSDDTMLSSKYFYKPWLGGKSAVRDQFAKKAFKQTSYTPFPQEQAAATNNIEYTNDEIPELSTEAPEASIWANSAAQIPAEAFHDRYPKSAGSLFDNEYVEGARATVSSNKPAGEETLSARHKEEQRKEIALDSEKIDEVNAKLYEIFPSVWNIAQFLAGR